MDISTTGIILQLVLIIILILINSFFSSTEMAIVSINKNKLKVLVEEGNLKINLKRENNIEIQSISKNIEKKVEIVEEPDEESFITSPIVGTFYSAASPETPAFVRVGDTVKKGQPVCIV